MKVKSRSRQPDKKDEQSAGILPWTEKSFRKLADNIIDGVYCVDTEGYFVFVNRAIIERSGISPDKFYEFHFLDIVHPAYHELAAQNFQRVMRGEDGIPYELRYESPDGREKIVEVHSRPLLSDGKVVGILGISRDITERKLAATRIKASEGQFRTLIESIPIGIVIYEGTKYSYVNPAVEKITGYTRDEIYLMDVWEIVHPEFKDKVREYVHKQQKGDPFPKLHVVKIIKKSGEERWVERGAIPIELGEKPSVLITQRDITEYKEAEEVIRKSEKKYRALLENASDAILLADEQGYLIEANRKAEEFFGYPREELLQMHYTQLHPMMELEKTIAVFRGIVTHGHGYLQNGAILRKDGMVVAVDITANTIEYNGRKVLQASFRDITEHKRIEDTLEELVKERTAELSEKNRQMIEEVMERKRAEAALRKKTNELQIRSRKLGELNATLKVLLKQREEDKTELEEKVTSNVKYLLSPHLEKLKKRKFDRKSRMHLDILESNLYNIVSSFSHRLSSKHINLTPTEIKVANMVKEGKTTKEIAEFLGSSPSSIKIHRFHIRRKLGLIGKETNLQSYLTSLS